MIPTEEEFRLLIEECEKDRFSFNLHVLVEDAKNVDEVFVINVLSDFETDLVKIRKHLDNNFAAYKWLYSQSQFVSALNLIFPKKDCPWMVNEAACILRKINVDSRGGSRGWFYPNSLLIELIGKSQLEMQAELKWISVFCSCFIRYYYPPSIYLNRMKEKSVDANQKIRHCIQAIKDIEGFSSYLNYYPVVNLSLISALDELASSLEDSKLDDYLIIKRADANFKERLFIAKIFNETLELGVGLKKYSVINAIFYILSMEGVVNSMGFKSVERACLNNAKNINHIPDYSKTSVTSLHSLISNYYCLASQSVKMEMQKKSIENLQQVRGKNRKMN